MPLDSLRVLMILDTQIKSWSWIPIFRTWEHPIVILPSYYIEKPAKSNHPYHLMSFCNMICICSHSLIVLFFIYNIIFSFCHVIPILSFPLLVFLYFGNWRGQSFCHILHEKDMSIFLMVSFVSKQDSILGNVFMLVLFTNLRVNQSSKKLDDCVLMLIMIRDHLSETCVMHLFAWILMIENNHFWSFPIIKDLFE